MIWFGHSLRDSLIYLIPLFRQKQRDPRFFFFQVFVFVYKIGKENNKCVSVFFC